MPYILYHLELLWAFVRGDDEALYKIDATPRGLVLSFQAVLIVEPIRFVYAALLGFSDELLLFRDGGAPLYMLQLLLDWAMTPLILFLFCNAFRYRDRLVPLIVASNWLSVILVVITLIPGALVTSQMLSGSLSVLVMMLIYGFVVWIAFRLYRFILECPTSMAIGLAVLMLILSIAAAIWLTNLANQLPSPDQAFLWPSHGASAIT